MQLPSWPSLLLFTSLFTTLTTSLPILSSNEPRRARIQPRSPSPDPRIIPSTTDFLSYIFAKIGMQELGEWSKVQEQLAKNSTSTTNDTTTVNVYVESGQSGSGSESGSAPVSVYQLEAEHVSVSDTYTYTYMYTSTPVPTPTFTVMVTPTPTSASASSATATATATPPATATPTDPVTDSSQRDETEATGNNNTDPAVGPTNSLGGFMAGLFDKLRGTIREALNKSDEVTLN